MSTLRVGFFTECYRPIVNGVVASVDALTRGLRSRGHEVYCFAPHMPGYDELDSSVLRIPSLPLPVRTAYRLTLPLVSRHNIERIVRKLSIIHTHSPFITGWMGVRYARRFNVPLVFTYHTQLEEYAHYIPFERHATRMAASQLTRAYANAADVVIVPTPSMKLRLQALGVTQPIAVIASGIDVASFSRGTRRETLRRRYGAGAGEPLVLSISRLAKEKNLALLLSALALAESSTHLLLVGDGPERSVLETVAMRLGIRARVHFAGELPREELADVYASADAFAFSSSTETQGLVLAEALAAGLPVVAVDSPQTREVLGGYGRLVPSDPRAFAAALRTALSTEPAARAHLRSGAKRFDLGYAAGEVLGVYESLVYAKPA